MSYIFTKKLNVFTGTEEVPQAPWRILLVETEGYLAGLYRNYLQGHYFMVYHCDSPPEAGKFVDAVQPHAVLFNSECHGAPENTLPYIKEIRKRFPVLPVITIAYNIDQELLKTLMSYGVASHIDRRHTRPHDIVVVTKTVLNM